MVDCVLLQEVRLGGQVTVVVDGEVGRVAVSGGNGVTGENVRAGRGGLDVGGGDKVLESLSLDLKCDCLSVCLRVSFMSLWFSRPIHSPCCERDCRLTARGTILRRNPSFGSKNGIRRVNAVAK